MENYDHVIQCALCNSTSYNCLESNKLRGIKTVRYYSCLLKKSNFHIKLGSHTESDQLTRYFPE